jgi:hypothetical protein
MVSFSAYRNLIKQGLMDMGINSNYGPYLLKYVITEKLIRLGLDISQINKVARYALNSTMALAHYNLTSSNIRAIALLSTQEQTKNRLTQSKHICLKEKEKKRRKETKSARKIQDLKN